MPEPRPEVQRDKMDTSRLIYQVTLTGDQYTELLRLMMRCTTLSEWSTSVALRAQLASANISMAGDVEVTR